MIGSNKKNRPSLKSSGFTPGNAAKRQRLWRYSTGFTLAEMLVSVGIFTVAVTVSSSVFLNINRLQQQTANSEKLQNEGRYVIERLAKEIRARELDYSSMNIISGTGMTNELIFKKDEFGEVLKLKYENKKIVIYAIDGSEKSAELNTEGVSIEQANFIVTPEVELSEMQPRVTMLLTIKNKAENKYQKTLTFQTTISSKVYR